MPAGNPNKQVLPTLAFVLLMVQFTPRAWSAGPLRTAHGVLALVPEELAQKPTVVLRGTVTYFKPEGLPDLIIQDDTGGVFIGGVTEIPAAGLPPGTVVEVEGTANSGSFAPRVQAGRVTAVGTSPLPAPEPAGFDDLRSGRLDCRYVEAAGVVQTATVDRGLNPPRLILRIATPAGQFYAWVLRYGGDDGQRFVDAGVRVRGVCLAWENPRRQPTSLRLLVNDLDAIIVTRPPPADAFAAPLASPDRLLRYLPEGLNQHRVRLRGVVTWWRPGDFLVIQGATFGVRVNSDERTPLKLGDEVEAIGFPALIGYSAGLQSAVYRVSGHPGGPVAWSVTARQFLTEQWIADTDQKLVRLQGTLRAVQRNGWEILLLMEDDGVDFTALLQRDESIYWPEEIEPGSRLELTGVCDVRPSERRRLVGGTPDGFALLLRERRDIVVLSGGPWLNHRRLLMILGLGAAGLFLAVLWAFTLRRRVEKRTALLAREIRSRHDAEVEFNATLGERTLIAADLHDTLQQSLTGVALQLEAAGLAARQSPERAPQHVETARQWLERSREDLRRSVWNLRHGNGSAPADLIAELHELAKSMTLGGTLKVEITTTGEPRPLSELTANNAFRIAQESLTNAIRHGQAKQIHIQAAFTQSTLTLRVTDDGRGFTPAAAPGAGTGHFGLHGMQERAQRLGGTLTIGSTPGGGTAVTLTTPLT